MFGFRVLAIIIGLVCLASAVSMVFYECPRMAPVTEYFIKHFIPDTEVRAFIKSQEPTDIKLKNIIQYTLGGLAVCMMGVGLLFFCAAVNPLRMRPFVAVVMICFAVGIVGSIWQGLRLGIFKLWWIGDASGALIVLILLAALFPRKRPVAGPPASESIGSGK